MNFAERWDAAKGCESVCNRLRNRSVSLSSEVRMVVEAVISEFIQSDERAEVLKQAAIKFDTPDLPDSWCPVTHAPITGELISPGTDAELAIKVAIERVKNFHKDQLAIVTEQMQPIGTGFRWSTDNGFGDGLEGQHLTPCQRVGIYVPGGRATYPSSVLMNVIPAWVAGCSEIVVATPPNADGVLDPALAWVINQLPIKTVILAGGAYAVAAFVYGIPGLFDRVDLIAGPGNNYLNEAKRQVWGQVGLDGFAGPSEVAIVYDGTTPVQWAVADYLAQIEHAEDNVGFAVCIGSDAAEVFEQEVDQQVAVAERKAVISKSIEKFGLLITVADLEQASAVVNAAAPEHVGLHCVNAEKLSKEIITAGSVMIGAYSSQSVSDYCAGQSHTIPTGRAARFSSPLNVMTFMKWSSRTQLGPESARALGKIAEIFGNMEGLPQHGFSGSVRSQV